MSAEEDDLEEEELLQMALREQAQRDINYQRIAQNRIAKRGAPPSNVKPRAPPVVPALKKSAPPPQAQPKPRPHQKEEVESEVEMLSISSDDDDLPPPKTSASGRGSGANYSNRSWDSDEPDSWKRVDEADLARRVRELRDAKAVPVVLQTRLRGKAANAGASTPRLPRREAGPRGGIEHIDPLGLGVIDLKTLTLIRDNEDTAPSSDISIPRDPSLREKVMYLSEKFDAKYFLSRIHQNTSAGELENSATALKTDLHDKTQQRKQLVKENFDCFVSCKTTIDDIQVKLKQIEEDPEGAGTAHLSNAIQDVDDLAKRALGTLFERQVQAEKIRSVQGILQRFRTLFNLPSTIRKNIDKGDYDLAVREYRRAKSLVLPSHVGVLKKVMEEVEKVVSEFKSMLYRSMEDPHIEQANLEHTIMLLLELEPESDPVWHYLNVQNCRIRGLLESCSIDYDVRMDALHSLQRDRILSDARWKQIQQESNKNCSVDYSILLGDYGSHPKETAGQEADALKGRLICMLTAVIAHHVPLFWRLALSIFSGKFAKLSQISSASGYPDPGKQGEGSNKQNFSEAKVAETKHSDHSLEDVAGMVQDIIDVYETKVKGAFHDFNESNIHCPYMREAIREISKAYSKFVGKDSAPKTAVRKLFALRAEVMKLFIARLCSWMKSAIVDIINDENWAPVSFLERSGSPFAISSLPLLFHDNIVAAMDQISEMVDTLKNDSYKPHDILMQVQQMQSSVKFTFLNCFLDFAGSLEKLSGDISQIIVKKEVSENGCTKFLGDKFIGLQPGIKITNSHQKLLMILSNIGFCKNDLLPKLADKYKLIWADLSVNAIDEEKAKEMEADISDLTASLNDWEEKVLTQYVNVKTSTLSTICEAYLMDDGFQWGGAPPVKGVRDVAIDLLHPLVAVHAEVYAGAQPFLEKTISTLTEGLMDTLLGIFMDNKTKFIRFLDVNGYCQLMLELDYFETVLHSFVTPVSQDALKSMRELLLEVCLETINNAMENAGHVRRHTRANEDGFTMDERQQETVASPDYLIEVAHQVSSDLLNLELKRTQMNVICFRETPMQIDPASDSLKPAFQTFNGVTALLNNHVKGVHAASAAAYSFHRRRPSASSLSDSDSGKHFGIHPYSPRHQYGYASSDVGSETGSSAEVRGRGPVNEKLSASQSTVRWGSRRMTRTTDEDLR